MFERAKPLNKRFLYLFEKSILRALVAIWNSL